jgi:predicted nucleic acid-binding protein
MNGGIVNVAKLVVDTNVFLAARDPSESGHDASKELLERIDDGKFGAIVSVITLAELRSGFLPAQIPALWTPFVSHIRASRSFIIEPVDETLALLAGELRSAAKLRLPDALILATAIHREADCVVTDDRELLRTKTSMAIRRPSDLLA